MSHERIFKTLVNLGLSPTDVEVYIHLATKGPQEMENIADAMRLEEELLQRVLENLKNKGIVTLKLQQSYLFFALPFRQVLNILMKEHLKETWELEQSKDKILSKWQKMIEDSKN